MLSGITKLMDGKRNVQLGDLCKNTSEKCNMYIYHVILPPIFWDFALLLKTNQFRGPIYPVQWGIWAQ